MKILNSIFTISIALVFVIASGSLLFSTAKVVNTGLRDYVFGVEDCYYPVYPTKDRVEPAPECSKDTNRTKRDLADGLAIMLVAGPTSFFLYRKLNKMK